jgi:hypothetical protein
MTKHRRPVTLRAHPNVIDLAERRRTVKPNGEPIMLVNFVGYRTREPETAPPTAPERGQRPTWLSTVLGLANRSRRS